MMPMYDVILADPPWHFQNYSADEPGMLHDRARGANKYYPTMTLDDIRTIEVPAKKDAILFLWACWPLLPEALQVIGAWGFEYKTLAWVWIKANPTGFGHHMGMGYYTRANSEPCLLATRGNIMKPKDRSVLSLIYSNVMSHSRKPDEQYEKIDRLYPNTKRLEMFARRRWLGWDVFGNQVTESISLPLRPTDSGRNQGGRGAAEAERGDAGN